MVSQFQVCQEFDFGDFFSQFYLALRLYPVGKDQLILDQH